MSIALSDVELKIEFSASGSEEIIQNIMTIITTPAGTVPFDRDLGIDWSILDSPIPQARAKLTIEYIEKVKKYEPRAEVRQITFSSNEQGKLVPRVVIGLVA